MVARSVLAFICFAHLISALCEHEKRTTPMIVILMGVAGAGKTTIGLLLAKELKWPFFDADDFHSKSNLNKMSRGIALDDRDRIPWLKDIRQKIQDLLVANQPAVIACSALKRKYRKMLRIDPEMVLFVYLKAQRDLIHHRMEGRSGHFMKADMLDSQFESLEEPEDALVVDASLPAETIVAKIQSVLKSYKQL